MPRLILHLSLLLFSCVLVSCKHSQPILRLGITTTQEDSGLLRLITQSFEQEHNIKIVPVIAGSGQLFRLIQRGEVDIAITHEPEGEQALLKQGIIEQRIPVFYNFFLLIGPNHNPANIQGTDSLSEAFRKLLVPKVLFVSRGDNSGTHKAEQAIWNIVAPKKKVRTITTGTGMGLTLRVAIEKQGYTLTDWGTWLHLNNKHNLKALWPALPSPLDLQALPNARSLLHNPYSLLVIRSDYSPAIIFQRWLIDSRHELVSHYHINHQRVFFVEN